MGHGANLGGLDLGEADLSGVELRNAHYNTQKKWPEDFDPIASGAVLVDDDD